MEEPKLQDQNGALNENREIVRMKNDPIGIHEIDDDDDDNISSCSSSTKQVRLAALAISVNVRLRSSDMPLHMQEHALRYTRSLTANYQADPSSKSRHNPTHLARALKKEFDSLYGPAWHCVIGKSFGSFVTYTPGGFVYFSIDSLYVLLFKTEVQLVTQKPPS